MAKINIAWILQMAWRDSRKNRSRMLLFITSIVLGIASLVAVYSFKDNLQRDIDLQAKELTGADLVIESRRALADKTLAKLKKLGDERAEERSFASMVYFPKSSGSRLIQVKALEGNYPFYGDIETSPQAAGRSFTKNRHALVDQTLMMQFGAKVGDSVKIGALNFAISGVLKKAPGQSGVSASIAPIVYIPLVYLEETGLTQIGSRITYKFFYRFKNENSLTKTIEDLTPQAKVEGFDFDTVASKKAETGRAFADMSRFMALSGFIALLLGCIGVGSAVHVYIQEKLSAIATLRCLGVTASQAFLIYLTQIKFIGLIGAIFGVALGTGIQFLLPLVIGDFLPIELNLQISYPAIAQGLILGVLIAVLFALPALLQVRKVSPLQAIRASFEPLSRGFDAWRWLSYALIALFIIGFSRLQLPNWGSSIAFTLGLGIALGALFLVAKLLLLLVKSLLPERFIFVWRQGFANLHRPNNQTLMLMVSIGLSTLLICTLFFVQGMLMSRLQLSGGENQPNMLLFDIQSKQKAGLNQLTKGFGLPLMNQVPIITMRIEEINGRKPGKDSTNNRAFRGELRATYQDTLTAAEEVVAGKWTGKVAGPDAPIFVSLENRYAKSIDVKLNDTIVFNVQGMRITTQIGSLRAVNWARMQTNFRVVFPTGVLESAPQFHVLMTKVPNESLSAKFQAAVVRAFPNVSVIDLAMVLKLLDELLSKIAFVIQFLAGFSMLTGWVVLLSAVWTSKNQRIKEIILLRTLGASRKQVFSINAIEYFLLGVFAALTGVILSVLGSWLLAKYSFDMPFNPNFAPVIGLGIGIVLLVMLTGLISTRKLLNQSPLKILRSES